MPRGEDLAQPRHARHEAAEFNGPHPCDSSQRVTKVIAGMIGSSPAPIPTACMGRKRAARTCLDASRFGPREILGEHVLESLNLRPCSAPTGAERAGDFVDLRLANTGAPKRKEALGLGVAARPADGRRLYGHCGASPVPRSAERCPVACVRFVERLEPKPSLARVATARHGSSATSTRRVGGMQQEDKAAGLRTAVSFLLRTGPDARRRHRGGGS